MFPYLWAIKHSNVPLILLFAVLLSGIAYSAFNSVWPALFGEMFDTHVRLSGTAIGTQLGLALSGFAPAVAFMLQGTGSAGWIRVSVLTLGTCVIAAIAIGSAPETSRLPLHRLGQAP
jgi:MFS family permease